MTRSTPHQNQKQKQLRWFAPLCILAALLVFCIQWRTISRLRHQIGDLRTQQLVPTTEQPLAAPAVEIQTAELEQRRKDKIELLRLRNEVRQLREELAGLRVSRTRAAQQSDAPPAAQPDEPIRLLGLAASAGDYAALDRLGDLSYAAHARLKTNAAGDAFADLRLVFDALGSDASKGSATALEALIRASRMDALQGFAVQALGKAAGQGNEQALEPLLDPDRYFLTRSSVVSALKPAADNGNVLAIQALATVATDPNSKPLWFLAAEGLQGAARAGNATAIDSLAVLVRSENQNVRRSAFVALAVLGCFGGIFYGVLPQQGPISWEGHLSGALAGIWAAKRNHE